MHAPPGPAPVPGAPLTQRPDARAGDPWPLLVLQSPQIYHIPASVIHPQALPLSTLWYAAPSSSTPRAKRPRRHARTTASTSALPRGPPTSSNAVRVIDLTSPPASLVQMLQPLEGTRLHATSSASTPGTSRSKSRARLPPLLPRPSPPQTLQSDVQSAHKPSGPPAVAVKPRVRREMPTKSTRETAHVTGFLSTAVGEREPPASAHLQPLLRLPRRSHAEYERQHPVGEHAGIPESASVPSASSFSEPRSSRHETSDEAVSSIGMPLSMPGENRVPVLVQSGRPTAARPRRSQAADKVSQARREPSRVHEQRGISSDLPHGGGRVSSTLHGTGMAPIRAVSLPSARGISSLVSSPLSPWSSAVASSVAEVSNEFPVLHQPSNVALPMPRPSLPQAGTDGTRREVAHVIVAPSRPRDTVTSGPGAACQEWPSAPRSDLSRCGSSGREQADVLSSPRVSEAGGAHKEGKGSRRQPSGSLSSYPSQSRDSLVSSPPPPAALVGVVLECLFRRQLIRRPFGAEAGADLSRQPVQSVPGARNEPVALTAPGSSQTTSAYGSAEAGPRALFENRTSAAVGESAGPQKHSETHHKSGTKAFPREAWAGASVDMAQQRTRYAADPTLNKEHPGLSSLSGPHEQKGVKRILTEVSRPRASEEAVDSMGSAGLPPTWRHKKFRRQPAPGQEEAKCSQRDSGGSEGHGKKEGDGV
ncbi:hypothetical protein BESB_026320 [Besnoitia besnoiti]|uniref:Uncharacterized protein n=1 Tax=Besnoitia besnoiti TaxID=94643 RepID=A0A2A9LYZ6_BESBE|nr:uncharacterized protein BESB_026320 [Besnoitia besnoiti]PFH31658.1 hypothetical protein BESB_026320 [Besnoitia besnoiti]